MSPRGINPEHSPSRIPDPPSPSRREFLKASAATLAAAALGPAAAAAALRGATSPGHNLAHRGNTWPGRIVVYHDSLMYADLVFDTARIEEGVARGVRILTGVSDTALAFEALFPGIQPTSRIAIKVNCIASCDTTWQTVRGIVAGLSSMLSGTYDITRVTIYDERDIGGHGYTPVNFDFGGVHPTIAGGLSTDYGYCPISGHVLCDYLVDCDYLINVPVLKSHYAPHEITAALKNHFGSCHPANICGDSDPNLSMLRLNADDYIQNKTALVVLDALRGTYNGGPDVGAQVWLTYPDGTPNTLCFSTDPVTNDYWARSTINLERAAHGWSAKACPWIEEASGDDYLLGVSDPASMVVVPYDPAAAPDEDAYSGGGIVLASGTPNPFRDWTDLRWQLPQAMPARLTVLDASGRVVRDLGERLCSAGETTLRWDGRDGHGKPSPAGIYIACLQAGGRSFRRRIVRVQ